MRILAKGRTHKECMLDINKKIRDGWTKVSKIAFDRSYIGGRYVCVMEKPDYDRLKNKFNQYMGS